MPGEVTLSVSFSSLAPPSPPEETSGPSFVSGEVKL